MEARIEGMRELIVIFLDWVEDHECGGVLLNYRPTAVLLEHIGFTRPIVE